MDTSRKIQVAVFNSENDIRYAVSRVFDVFDFGRQLRGGKRVFIKVNGIDFKPFSYTDPDVLNAVLGAVRDFGAREICVMENCTQGNCTRLVFKETGYNDICRRHNARPLYLDEGRQIPVHLAEMGYDVHVNYRLAPLINEPESKVFVLRQAQDERIFLHAGQECPISNSVYINLPKLKTHSMSTVTLGIKNQLGLIAQADRTRDHNFNLHRKLVDIFRIFQPSFTLIDGIHLVHHGHYPNLAQQELCVEKLGLIIGGGDTLAVDAAGAKLLGYEVDEVEHLRLARDRKLGCGDFENIQIVGDWPNPTRKYECDILMEFPPDLAIIRGNERCCREGCRKNTESLLQTLYVDFGGKGGFTVLMGKGFNPDEISKIQGPVHIAGDCAIGETFEILKNRGEKSLITLSPGCNSLALSIQSIARQMGVRVLDLTPHPLGAALALFQARLHGSKALVPKIF